jgi:hypothetical protein
MRYSYESLRYCAACSTGLALQLVDGLPIVLDGLRQVGVVFGLALVAGLVEVVVAVAQEEVGVAEVRIVEDRLLVQGNGAFVFAAGVELIGILERFERPDAADGVLPAGGRRDGDAGDRGRPVG